MIWYSVNAREKERFCIGSKNDLVQCKRSLRWCLAWESTGTANNWRDEQAGSHRATQIICGGLENWRSVRKLRPDSTISVLANAGLESGLLQEHCWLKRWISFSTQVLIRHLTGSQNNGNGFLWHPSPIDLSFRSDCKTYLIRQLIFRTRCNYF